MISVMHENAHNRETANMEEIHTGFDAADTYIVHLHKNHEEQPKGQQGAVFKKIGGKE